MVGRQDLSVGMDTSIASSSGSGGGGGDLGDGRISLLPLSEEERDVRLAELMSFGVDLPSEMLITLLRFVGCCCVNSSVALMFCFLYFDRPLCVYCFCLLVLCVPWTEWSRGTMEGNLR